MKTKLIIKLTLFSLLVSGCGRYGDPLIPEAYSPKAIQELKVTSDPVGVNFDWKAPADDQRDRELKSINGYNIYRKPLVTFERLLDDESTFEKIAQVTDTHLLERDRLRKEAIASGQVGRKVTVPIELKSFVFSDQNLEPGFSYVYKIVPYNNVDVEGLVQNYVKVKFLGSASVIVIDTSPEISPLLVANPY